MDLHIRSSSNNTQSTEDTLLSATKVLALLPSFNESNKQQTNLSKDKNGEEEYTFSTVQELQKYLRGKLVNGSTSEEAIVLNFEGKESIEELVNKVFIAVDPNDPTETDLLSANGVSPSLSVPEKEKLYRKLKQNLVQAGAYGVENCQLRDSTTPPPFKSTEDLLKCLLDGKEELTSLPQPPPTTSTTTTYLADPRMRKKCATMTSSSSVVEAAAPLPMCPHPRDNSDSSSDSDILFICEYDSTSPVPQVEVSSENNMEEFSAPTPNTPQETQTNSQGVNSFAVVKEEPRAAFLGAELSNYMADTETVRPGRGFEDIPIPTENDDLGGAIEKLDLVPVDLHETLEEYLPNANDATNALENQSKTLPTTAKTDESEDDSFCTAKTSLTPDRSANTTGLSDVLQPLADANLDNTPISKERGNKTVPTIAQKTENIPILTNEEVAVCEQFGCSHVDVAVERLDSEIEKALLWTGSVSASSILSMQATSTHRKARKTAKNPKTIAKTHSEVEIEKRRTSPRKKRPTSHGSSCCGGLCVSEVKKTTTTNATPVADVKRLRKTRIKARKPTAEELELAKSAHLPPEQIFIQRLSVASSSSAQSACEEPQKRPKDVDAVIATNSANVSAAVNTNEDILTHNSTETSQTVITQRSEQSASSSSFDESVDQNVIAPATIHSRRMPSIEEELEDALLGTYPVLSAEDLMLPEEPMLENLDLLIDGDNDEPVQFIINKYVLWKESGGGAIPPVSKHNNITDDVFENTEPIAVNTVITATPPSISAIVDTQPSSLSKSKKAKVIRKPGPRSRTKLVEEEFLDGDQNLIKQVQPSTAASLAVPVPAMDAKQLQPPESSSKLKSQDSFLNFLKLEPKPLEIKSVSADESLTKNVQPSTASSPAVLVPAANDRESESSLQSKDWKPGPKSKTLPLLEIELTDEKLTEKVQPSTDKRRLENRPTSTSTTSNSSSHVTLSKTEKAKKPLVQKSSPQESQISSKKCVTEECESSSSDSGDEDDGVDLNAITFQPPDIKTYLRQLNKELSKKAPNKDKIVSLMCKTRSYRQVFLSDDNYDMQHGFKMFPAFKDYTIIKLEFNKMFPALKKPPMQALEEGLDTLFTNCVNVRRRPGQVRHVLWERALAAARSPSNSAQMKKILGMTCLCFHQAENDTPKKLFYVKQKNKPIKWKKISTPRVVVKEKEMFEEDAKKMWIYAEGLRHLRVHNIYEGVLTVYALHYIFNVEYEKSLRGIFKEFDKLAGIIKEEKD